MSTILKALRRLEQEKSTRSDRPLGETIAGAAPVPSSPVAASRRWSMLAGIAIGVGVLGVSAFWLIQWRLAGADSAPVEVAALPAEIDAPAAPGRALAVPERKKRNPPNSNRRPRPTRKIRAESSTPRGPAPAPAPEPDVAVVARPQPTTASRLAATQTPASTVTPVPSGGAPVIPSKGGSPVIDLSELETLRAAAKAAKATPEPMTPARVLSSPPTPETTAPLPSPRNSPPPVEVAAARPAAEPVTKSAPRAEPAPKATPLTTPEPDPPPARTIARKSPPRPASAPPQPKVYVSRTVWHPDASRRVAHVEYEGREGVVVLHEGENIGPLLVKEISPTEVSFDNRGSELTRRVGAR